MSRRVSLNARQAQIDPVSAEIDVVLIEITHPDLDAPIRLSTDNTERISDEPLIYGTRSPGAGLTLPLTLTSGSSPRPCCLTMPRTPRRRRRSSLKISTRS